MILYQDSRFVLHETGKHPEKPERIRCISEHLAAGEFLSQVREIEVPLVSLERVQRVHAADYVRELEDFAQNHGGYIEADTVVSDRSFEVARLAAGAVSDAVTRVLKGEDTRAACLVRPPGHHAVADAAMGFCLFNSVAVATRVATHEFDLERVLVVDFDVHHGNGTQDCFYRDPTVAFLSIHRFPFYPGSGAADESGAGPGLGTTVNLPVTFGTPPAEYHQRFEKALEELADRFRPQLVLVSAGFDAHRADPIGSLELDVEDFGRLTAACVRVAEAHSAGKLVSVLEGGYNTDVLPLCVAEHLRTMR